MRNISHLLSANFLSPLPFYMRTDLLKFFNAHWRNLTDLIYAPMIVSISSVLSYLTINSYFADCSNSTYDPKNKLIKT